MKYVMTLIWSMLLSLVVSYVLGSMAGDPFLLSEAVILGVIFFIAIIALGMILDPKKQEQ
ncbi:MAG TPA: YjzD family protein [Pseudogracilibacillus sp.]|nr:YjzD family protein [Pseudogracilibacillus sp.]